MTRLKQAWLALCGVALLAGCMPESVLVCTTDGKVTYRSPSSTSWRTVDGVWVDGGWDNRYKQSAFESCHTEITKGARKQ